MPEHNTHFGYREVPVAEKVKLVTEVFQSVAAKYDLMNDLMSLGAHRHWKKLTVSLSRARAGQKILDLAGGTGDLAAKFVPLVGAQGEVILADINPAMLTVARQKLIDAGIVGTIKYVTADAELLPFETNYFDCITIAFGLRNVTNKAAALRDMLRVLKPGGQVLILEFSKPVYRWLNTLYDFYSFNVIPRLGKLIANDASSYQYLVESIRMHPNQEALLAMMQDAGFEDSDYRNLNGGIVAIHRGYKY